MAATDEEQLLKSLGLSANPETVLVVQGQKQLPKFICQYHGKSIDSRVGIPIFKGKESTEIKKMYGSFGTWDAVLAFINYCVDTGRCDALQAMQLSSNVQIVADQGVVPIAAVPKVPKNSSEKKAAKESARPGKLVIGHPETGQRYRDFEQLTKDCLVSPLGLKQYHLAILPGQTQPLMAIRQTKILKEDLKELKTLWALEEPPSAVAASSSDLSGYLPVSLNSPLKKSKPEKKKPREQQDEETVVEPQAKKQKKVVAIESKKPSPRKPSAHPKESRKQKNVDLAQPQPEKMKKEKKKSASSK